MIVWPKFETPFGTHYYHIPKIYHFLSYVIMACQWINFRHQTKQVPYIPMPTALGMKIESQIKHLIVFLALAEIPIMLALCVRAYVLPYLSGWKSNNVCWICSNLGTLEIQLSFDLSVLFKLSRKDDGIFQCHASTLSKISRLGLRCITAKTLPTTWVLPCVEGCFLWNVWWICCWHTMQT